jgi:maleylpyruvate isomerase
VVSADPLVLVDEVDRATTRLLDSAQRLPGDSAVTEPSLLPGWSRGHLLTHLARHADAMVNLFTWVSTGVPTPAYPSPQARAEGIEAGAGRPLEAQLADLRAASARLTALAHDLPADRWAVQLPLDHGPQVAARIPWRRLREVEVHHVDLAAGYSPADWPESFAHRLLHDVADSLPGVDLTLHVDGLGHAMTLGAGGPVITGSAANLAAWLSGRSPGTGLTADSGTLPSLPAWM